MSTSVSTSTSNGLRQRPWAAWAGFILCISLVDTARADVKWNGSLALTSDYVQQGLSQTRGEPALQGGLRAEIDGKWTVGAWASSIDRYDGPSASTEIDVYAARAWKISPEWIAALTATHYFYPNDVRYVRYDYDEVAASLGYRSMLFATVAWSPNYAEISYRGASDDRTAVSYELSANQPILGSWSGNVGLGYRDLSELFDEQYWYGHAGLMLAAKRITVHLTYTYVDPAARRLFGHERAANTLSGTLIWRFGAID
jgi:uncharacterized protein (TIGR02001 family)